MTPLSDIYAIAHNELLTFEVLKAIYTSGYTRIPVYQATPATACTREHASAHGRADPPPSARRTRASGSSASSSPRISS